MRLISDLCAIVMPCVDLVPGPVRRMCCLCSLFLYTVECVIVCADF